MNDHIPDPTKMISDTPRTDEAQFGTGRVSVSFARQLERQLNAANERIPLLIAERDTARRQADQKYKLREEFLDLLGTNDVEQGVAAVREMKERIKRLEEAGNALLWYFCPKNTGDISFLQSEAIKQWNKAKEAKP
jgi:hypothetical protein